MGIQKPHAKSPFTTSLIVKLCLLKNIFFKVIDLLKTGYSESYQTVSVIFILLVLYGVFCMVLYGVLRCYMVLWCFVCNLPSVSLCLTCDLPGHDWRFPAVDLWWWSSQISRSPWNCFWGLQLLCWRCWIWNWYDS